METLEQYNELVAAQARDRVLFPNAGAKAACNLRQERVADFVAKAVIDLLEVVDIEEQ